MTDTSPKRLRELVKQLWGVWGPEMAAVCSVLYAIADEKEEGPFLAECPFCGSNCNERDELMKAEREIDRLRAEKGG